DFARQQQALREEEARKREEARPEVAFAFWSQEVRVRDDLFVTIFTDPQGFPYVKSQTFLFAPLELKQKAQDAVQRYLAALGVSGSVSAGSESIIQGSFLEARKKVREIFDRGVADRRQHPSEFQVYRFVIVNPETGSALQEQTIARGERRKPPSGAGRAL